MFGDLGFNFCLMPFIRPVNIKDDERTLGFGVATPFCGNIELSAG